MSKSDELTAAQADVKFWEDLFPGLILVGFTHRITAIFQDMSGRSIAVNTALRDYMVNRQKWSS